MLQPVIGREIIHLKRVDSTNSHLMRLADEGADEGLAVIADRQTAGRGRRGRSFQSTKGLGLYLSVLVRPDIPVEDVPQLTAWTAVAVCDGIQDALGYPHRPGIKWVNDIVAQGRKLGGILTEMALKPDGTLSHVVIGIGINVYHTRDDFAPELQDTAISIAQWLDCDLRDQAREHLAACILRALDDMYCVFPTNRSSFLNRYHDDCVTIGRLIRVLTPDGAIPAVARGIDDRFRLLVRYDDGSTAALDSGEVSVRGLWDYV